MSIEEKIKERFNDRIVKFQQTAPRRIYIDLNLQDIPAIVKFIFQDLGCRFATVSGVDTPQGLELLYHFSEDSSGKMISLRTLIKDKTKPEIESITPIIKAAEWIEREIWEMLGVNFLGHPNLKRLLLAEDWPEGEYPLRRG
jgi:NADH:ubiquinone oxidoreductase subunit C